MSRRKFLAKAAALSIPFPDCFSKGPLARPDFSPSEEAEIRSVLVLATWAMAPALQAAVDLAGRLMNVEDSFSISRGVVSRFGEYPNHLAMNRSTWDAPRRCVIVAASEHDADLSVIGASAMAHSTPLVFVHPCGATGDSNGLCGRALEVRYKDRWSHLLNRQFDMARGKFLDCSVKDFERAGSASIQEIVSGQSAAAASFLAEVIATALNAPTFRDAASRLRTLSMI